MIPQKRFFASLLLTTEAVISEMPWRRQLETHGHAS